MNLLSVIKSKTKPNPNHGPKPDPKPNPTECLKFKTPILKHQSMHKLLAVNQKSYEKSLRV